MTHLTVFNVSVAFPLYHSESRSLKKEILDRASSRFGRDHKRRPVVQALQNISFTLRSGDRLGLVGANGSGKTTLLRTLSGIYQPTIGSLSIEGRVTSILDPGQGMNMDMSGRENIRLRGYFLGVPASEIARLEADVEDFSDLGEFLDLPVRNYSSGMVVRLAFAMATAIRPEILLMDEWIMAGDAAFMEKARARIEGMVRHADVLVLASHSAPILGEWCNRVIWIDQGRIRADAAPIAVLEEYLPAEQFSEFKAIMVESSVRKVQQYQETPNNNVV
jgi:lipopolysaccharide transport system ATP-binding protein